MILILKNSIAYKLFSNSVTGLAQFFPFSFSSVACFLITIVLPFFKAPEIIYFEIGLRNSLRITPDNCLAPYLGCKAT